MRTAILASLVLFGLTLGACGSDDSSKRANSETWSPSGETIETRGLAWATDSTVHLGDGTELELGQSVYSFVVARDGVYAVLEPDEDDDGSEQPPTLIRATSRGTDPMTDRPDPGSLVISSDGRYLGFIDRGGETDTFTTPVAEAVVLDVTTGREILRSSAGMGNVDTDDLADLYEELEPSVLGFSEDAAYVQTTDDVRKVDLATGEIEVVGDNPDAAWGTDWFEALRPDHSTSPDGSWTIDADAGDESPEATITGKDGTVVSTTFPGADLAGQFGLEPIDLSWQVDSWLDNATAMGTASWRTSPGGDFVRALISCPLPSGECTTVPGSSGDFVLPSGQYVVVRTALPTTP